MHSLSTRSREPFRTSLDLTDTYGTPGDMSIYFSRRAGHGTNHAMFEASALHRAPVPSCATYRSMESARSGHGSMLQPCASLAYSASTGSWQITHQRTSAARAGRAGRSSLGPTRAPIRGAHRHGVSVSQSVSSSVLFAVRIYTCAPLVEHGQKGLPFCF